jgi:hypothetical protein
MESAENNIAGTWQPFGLETETGHLFAILLFLCFM